MKIAIDGPAGAGKSSAAREVAKRLGYKYLDTGAMYRAITVQALEEKIDLQDENALVELTRRCELELKGDAQKGNLILLNGRDITTTIRLPIVNKHVSIVAAAPGVRKELVNLQRRTALKSGNIVMEGRDIGSNVLVDAEFKFYLSATVDARAKRRWLEMREQGIEVPLDELRDDISMRDHLDQKREDSPLCVAPDACVIDTTPYSLAEVVNKIMAVVSTTD